MSSLKEQLTFELCDNLNDEDLHMLLAVIMSKLDKKQSILEISQQLLQSITDTATIANEVRNGKLSEEEIIDIGDHISNKLLDRLTDYVTRLAKDEESQEVNHNGLLN